MEWEQIRKIDEMIHSISEDIEKINCERLKALEIYSNTLNNLHDFRSKLHDIQMESITSRKHLQIA